MEDLELRAIGDDALLARLDALARQERESVADLVRHLMEADRREIVQDRGYTSLYDYCRKSLHYSDAEAFLRMRAARAARHFPRVLEELRAGTLRLDGIARLYPHLEASNADAVLDRASGASKREIMKLSVELGAERPVERDVVRFVPAAETPAARVEQVLPPPRVRLSFSADEAFLRDLERLRGLIRHQHPDGRLEDVLGDAVTARLRQLDPDLRPSRPAKPRPKLRRRQVPRSVQREVWARDGGRCAYTAPDGRRCEAREFLEFDHVVPWALGGPSDDAGNIRLLCRPHNQRLARRRFGPRGR